MKKINMKGMRKLSITATAMVAAAVMALAGCGSSGTADSAASGSSGSAKSDTFMAAGLFPLTGSMAYLGPANIATMKLAQKDINAAGGVLGKDIEITSADTSDADHADQNTSSAQKGGATDGTTVQKNLMAVSGSTKGKECDSYKACLALLKDGKEIQYKGQTSIGAFNDAHDPSSASIGVYKYDADNKPVFDHSQEGSVPKA